MSFQIPEGYRRLIARYGTRVVAGASVSEEGAVLDRFWIVLSGRLAVYSEDASGARMIAREAGPGESVGLAAALAERPVFADAGALEASDLLAIPVKDLPDVFRVAPELAVALLREATGASNSAFEGLDDGDMERVSAEAPERDADDGPPTAETPELVRLTSSFDEESFFVDEAECPVSGTRFQYLRTRAGAMRPSARDSDFRIAYRGVNPTHYSVVVCPGCSYAAYHDDFAQLEPHERERLIEAQAKRDVFGRPNLCGERTLEQALLSLTLARHCYEARSAGARRRAGLLHRQAWLERERSHQEAELRLLREARDAYIEAFERDGDLSESAALRAAYVIGELALRLGEPMEAGRWLETCLRMPELANQKGLERMVRDRVSDAREMLERLGDAA